MYQYTFKDQQPLRQTFSSAAPINKLKNFYSSYKIPQQHTSIPQTYYYFIEESSGEESKFPQ